MKLGMPWHFSCPRTANPSLGPPSTLHPLSWAATPRLGLHGPSLAHYWPSRGQSQNISQVTLTHRDTKTENLWKMCFRCFPALLTMTWLRVHNFYIEKISSQNQWVSKRKIGIRRYGILLHCQFAWTFIFQSSTVRESKLAGDITEY